MSFANITSFVLVAVAIVFAILWRNSAYQLQIAESELDKVKKQLKERHSEFTAMVQELNVAIAKQQELRTLVEQKGWTDVSSMLERLTQLATIALQAYSEITEDNSYCN